ncbi:hypothetical protein [Bradyrhizobium sp. CCBAU 051011]|uniref:hypothetical protein n=1 Tax=Bradyrhizobium sp. CCBAU 051011 TaxID=858422 RepID=UPI001FF007FA|nr:hypothetical protein [Bradyrhizobium sp. CCBAU 051011]
MRFWSSALSWRTFCARAFTSALAIALLLATLCQSQAADPEPKRVLMLHSFGLRFKPWTTYAEALRTEMSRRKSVDSQDQSLLSARLSSDKSDGPFVDYLRALNADQPPDLILAIGAPAANFVQRHRKDLFPTTPMVFSAVERRRVDFQKLTEYDTWWRLPTMTSFSLRIFCVSCHLQRSFQSLSALRLTRRFGAKSCGEQPRHWPGACSFGITTICHSKTF